MEAANIPGNADRILSHPSFGFFNVAHSKEKLFVCFADILLAESDDYDSRHKAICIKNEPRAYILMNVPFTMLYVPHMVMVNKHTLVSLEAIHSNLHEMITLKNIFPGWNNKQITLSRKYKAGFHVRFK